MLSATPYIKNYFSNASRDLPNVFSTFGRTPGNGKTGCVITNDAGSQPWEECTGKSLWGQTRDYWKETGKLRGHIYLDSGEEEPSQR